MKTTLRYLLIVVAMVSVLGAYAQGLAKRPEATMQSTSVMVYSGSNLPQAALTGTFVTGNTVGTYMSAKTHPGSIRRGTINGGTEPGTGGPQDRPEPYEDPLGDVLWPLMLLAGAYALMRVILKYKARGRKVEKNNKNTAP